MPKKKKSRKTAASLKNPRISDATVKRLSKYYRTLNHAILNDRPTISSEEIATHNGVTSAQVRKDLSMFGAFGRRGLGYAVHELYEQISNILGLNRTWNVALVGAGNIGTALVHFKQFSDQGFMFRLILDSDRKKFSQKISGLPIQDFDKCEALIEKEQIKIAVLAVPTPAAQRVADRLVEAGIKAILNFAPITLQVPRDVHIRNENMAIEIEALSYALTNKRKRAKEEL
jgi:redox-sensing transcriptional repressor